MESEHISKDTLRDVVDGKATLDQSEVEHLRKCDECMETIRDLVHQQFQRARLVENSDLEPPGDLSFGRNFNHG